MAQQGTIVLTLCFFNGIHRPVGSDSKLCPSLTTEFLAFHVRMNQSSVINKTCNTISSFIYI